MFVASKSPELSKFNVTEDHSSFSDSSIGALYIPPQDDFIEIEQYVLDALVIKNHQKPLIGYDLSYLEFFPNEIFIERSFTNLSMAEQFIEDIFTQFDTISTLHRDDIISKLQTFASVIPSKKKLNCRFEVLSGNSCKKFHVDEVEARLIYTCAGPGTQVKLPSEEKHITLPSGSALIVKGEDYPEFKEVTLHRSPPIDGTNIKRFLFIADFQ
jgi:hypothetical protein